jgi:hypothetical protein
MMADDWVMGALAAQDAYQPVVKPWTKYDVAQLQSDDLDRMPFGVGSPAESAHAPSGIDQLVRSAYTGLGETAKGAFTESERLRSGEGYNAKPAVEAALMTMGGPLVGGTKATAEGGVVLGSGPIKAYHSSPHTFEKFDTSRIGTGEGAQVYGHGLYFAENPAVSGRGGEYWNQFLHRFEGPERKAATALQREGFDREAVMADLQKSLADVTDHMKHRKISDPLMAEADRAHWQKLKDNWQTQYDLLKSGGPVGPRTYEVDIHADPKHMLDWDKPIKDQPEVLGRIRDSNVILPYLRDTFEKNAEAGIKGSNAYKSYIGSGDVGASQLLRDHAGVPGIKYLDQGSRNPAKMSELAADLAQYREAAKHWAATGNEQKLAIAQGQINALEKRLNQTNNYVIFDPKIIDIRKMYGIGGIGAGVGTAYGMGGLAAQDHYGERL